MSIKKEIKKWEVGIPPSNFYYEKQKIVPSSAKHSNYNKNIIKAWLDDNKFKNPKEVIIYGKTI